MRYKASAPIPFASESQDWFLPLLLGLMQYLLSILLVCFLLFHGLVLRWDVAVRGHMILEVVDADQNTINNMLSTIESFPGVKNVEPVPQSQVLNNLQPWLGSMTEDLLAGIPLPRLIDVELLSGIKVDSDTLLLQLRQKFPQASVDVSQSWVEDILDLIKALRVFSLVLLGLLTLIIVAVVSFVVNSRLRVHGEEIELLHIIGATDNFVAKLFQRQILWSSIKGAFAGLIFFVLTIVAMAGLAYLTHNNFLLDSAAFAQTIMLPSLAALIILPFVMMLMSVLTARFSVIHYLRQMF